MALLRILDKYAQERGGWKTDQVMKLYIEPAADEINRGKYQAWLTLFEKDDNRESKKAFLQFMQHEMQHELKKAT